MPPAHRWIVQWSLGHGRLSAHSEPQCLSIVANYELSTLHVLFKIRYFEVFAPNILYINGLEF